MKFKEQPPEDVRLVLRNEVDMRWNPQNQKWYIRENMMSPAKMNTLETITGKKVKQTQAGVQPKRIRQAQERGFKIIAKRDRQRQFKNVPRSDEFMRKVETNDVPSSYTVAYQYPATWTANKARQELAQGNPQVKKIYERS